MNRVWGLSAGVAASLLLSGGAAAAGPAKVYVADEDSATVSVIETANLKRVAVVPVGKPPHVSVVEVAGKGPHDVRVSPDGRLAWVTNEYDRRAVGRLEHRSSGRGAGELTGIDTRTDRIVARIPVGRHPAHVVLTRDARLAYVTNSGENTVSVVDTEARREVAVIPVGASPHGIRLSPGEREAYVASPSRGTLSILDLAARREVARISVGNGATEVAVTPDGRLAFVSVKDENAVAVLDIAGRRVIRTLAAGPLPAQVAVTPDSRFLLVVTHGAEPAASALSVIDVTTLTVAATLGLERGAHGVTVSGDGRWAYVTNAHTGSLLIVDLGTRTVIATVGTGRGPHGVSVMPDDLSLTSRGGE